MLRKYSSDSCALIGLTLGATLLMGSPGVVWGDGLGVPPGTHDLHARHRAALEQVHYARSENDYVIPDVALVDSRGATVRLLDLLGGDGSVLMQFIFTTCSTICPVLSASFAVVQDDLKAMDPDVRMLSISIDPEYDTPETLRAYAARFRAGSQWHFLTGSRDTVARIQKAFDAYYPGNNKMYHQPYTYLHAGPGSPWVRLDGLLGAAELTAEYRRMHGPRSLTVSRALDR